MAQYQSAHPASSGRKPCLSTYNEISTYKFKSVKISR